MENRKKGQVSTVEYAILGLVIVSIIISGVAIAMMPSVPKNVVKKSDLEGLASQSDINSLNDRIASLKERQSKIMEKLRVKKAPSLSVTSLNVPSEVTAGQTATISAIVTNTGGKEGTKTIDFVVEGKTINSREVTVGPGESKTVSFKITKSEKGTYNLKIGGTSATLTVSAAPAPDRPLRIGIVYPKTGIYSAIGPWVKEGEMMAIEDYGKIFGYEPTVYVRDSHTEKTKAISAAKSLIKRKNIDIMLGAINTPINNAVATVCDKNKVPFLYPSGGSMFMSGIEGNPHPYMFFSNWNAKDESISCVPVAERYGPKWYFITSDYKYGHDWVHYAKKILKKEVPDYKNVGESWLPQGATDYTGAISSAKAANPDVVCVNVPGVFTSFQKQAVSLGLTEIAHIHWGYASRPTGLAAGEKAEGVTSFTNSPPAAPSLKEWAKRFHEKFGHWPGWPASQAYNGTQMFLNAVEKARSYKGLDIVKQLEGMRYKESIFGPKTYFRAVNHHIRYPCYIVKWTLSKKYNGGYWKVIKKVGMKKMEELSIPVENTANYPKMRKE